MDSTYALRIQEWSDVSEVDWHLVRDELANYLRQVIAHFSQTNAAKQVYGIVIELGQNWTMSVYLNTEEGLADGPMRFRSDSVGYEKHTDAQILEMLGRWHYESWEFPLYQYNCPDRGCPNEPHRELFERLVEEELESENEEPESVSELFLGVCAEATAILEQSRELKELSKTPDFALRLYDADCYEWGTDDIMKAARKKVAGSEQSTP
ncbi:hypothetical protein [Roseimicrobium sp. ORNL1]|uniref:hypothetical protein n=1 Tax=Roseimicrobium sp. ORNL1 TaxID=2711231 RepID=UPI0013E15442|nr:hypothetical protein [Roseimicrobium sp. ORNL1]QIF03525.1 hypothetical protein G5S37_19010 [Roseimicrobium sp. ORNL1]